MSLSNPNQPAQTILDISFISVDVMKDILELLNPRDIFSFLKVSKFANSYKNIVNWKTKADEMEKGYERTDPSKSGYHRFLVFLFNADILSYLTFDLLDGKAIITKLLLRYYKSPGQFYKYANMYTDYDMTKPMKFLKLSETMRSSYRYGLESRQKVSLSQKYMFTVPNPIPGKPGVSLLPPCVYFNALEELVSEPPLAYVSYYRGEIWFPIGHRKKDMYIQLKKEDIDNYLLALTDYKKYEKMAEMYHGAINFGKYYAADRINHIISEIDNEDDRSACIAAICHKIPSSVTGYIPPDFMSVFKMFDSCYFCRPRASVRRSISSKHGNTIIIQKPMLDNIIYEGKEMSLFKNFISRTAKRMILEMSLCTNLIKLQSLYKNFEYIMSKDIVNITLGCIKIIGRSTNISYIDTITAIFRKTDPSVICSMELYVYEHIDGKYEKLSDNMSDEMARALGISR